MAKSHYFSNVTTTCLREKSATVALDYLLDHLTPSSVIGVGTGATVEVFLTLLVESRADFAYCVSSSERSSKAIQALALNEQPLSECSSVDFYIDGIDEGTMEGATIKGGGAALAREKILATQSNVFITIADQGRKVEKLGTFPLPIEVLPAGRASAVEALQQLGGNPVQRADCVTDNGNIILDTSGLPFGNSADLEWRLNTIPGVVENGIFAHRKADFMAFSDDNGVEWVSVTE